ncbi:uncharacterized protein LOC127289064 [Leptopilina boulardi]|uniref:uncharacterized protein LOC127289064 n=1 Tax=Leptopilina boulardi TaxID=63433 RepID=UPI0021F56F26|nr:uncharacterized protein LOC127289064 [Leptopilina boulardi]
MHEFSMNNTSIFNQQSSDFQFLSACHYITILGIYFYNNDLITLEERNQTVPVLNTFFEYINKSKNETEAKHQLLKTILKGSDLYGGQGNETLDMKYVNETYQYIISTTLFSHYGNINGYLAKIINRGNNTNYSYLKENVFQHLSENYTSREYCLAKNYSLKLTPLTIKKVFQDHIWTIFPQPEQDMSIIEVNYIYAMVGLKIIRSVSADAVSLTFQEYILISREIDLHNFSNEIYEMVLKLFSTPALFFYAFNQKVKFREIDYTLNDGFWNEAYENLFSHISFTVKKIVQEDIKNSLHYKLEKKISALKSRTFRATEILRFYCDYENYAQVPVVYVQAYMTFYLWLTILILPDHCLIGDLPDLEKVYEDQFIDVRETYNAIEKNAIEKVLVDGKMVEKMNFNSVMLARVPTYPMHCMYCPPMDRRTNSNIYLLFAIKKEGENDFYALRQENNTLTLLTNSGNEQEFSRAIANDSSLQMENEIFSKALKYRNEDYGIFIERVADIKTTQFLKSLKMYYYDETLGEKFLNYVKSLIPFYKCIESAKAGNVVGATFICSMDVLSLIPLVGFAAKYTATLSSSLTVEIGKKYLITNTLVRAGIINKLPITTALNEISRTAARTIATEILTKRLLKDLAVASIRTVDPGFELSYQVSRFGFQALRNLFRNMISNFKNIPAVKSTVAFIKSLITNVKQNLNVPDQMGLLPLVLAEHNGYNLVRYFYPGGSQLFGPACVQSFGKTAELRSIEGYSFQIPVVPVKSNGAFSYKQYIPETGKITDIEFQKGNNDVLHRLGELLNELVIGGQKINLLHNYHVFHHEIKWNKVPAKEQTEIFHQPIEEPNQESLQNPANTRENIMEQHTNSHIQENLPNSKSPITMEENTGNKFPQVTNSELPGTSTGIARKEHDYSQSLDPLYSMNKKYFVNTPSFLKLDIPEMKKILLVEDGSVTQVQYRHKKFDAVPEKIRKVDVDDIPGTSRQFVKNVDSTINNNIIRYPIYTKEVEILRMLKNYGLAFIKTNNVELNFLRTTINKLALLQLETGLSQKAEINLWYTQIVYGHFNKDVLRQLRGNTFFFNDITLLENKPPGPFVIDKIRQSLEVEVRYYLTIDSSYCGFVDLTHFHDEFKGNYITFSDVLFTVTDSFFILSDKILIVHLRNKEMSKDLWQHLRQRDISNLLNEEVIKETARMKTISKVANFISENALLHTFKTSQNVLSNYILNINPSGLSSVPTYEKLAHDLIHLNSLHSYNDWKIESNKYIQDVLLNYNLDEITELSEAKKIINEIYDFVYTQNIEEAFENYRKIVDVKRYLRFEDYYVLYSSANNKLVMTKDGVRRFEAAIHRLALKQCSEEIIMKPIILYRGEKLDMEMSLKLKSIDKNNIIKFDRFMKFSVNQIVEESNCLNMVGTSSQIPLLMEIKITNHIGVVDINRLFNDGNPFHIATANFEFVLNDIRFKTIKGRKVLYMKLSDYDSGIEKRMVQMARRLHELFSTDTTFYSDIVRISQ